MGRTKNFADVIRAKVSASPDLANALESEFFNADVAMKVYEARIEAGLSQKQLADMIGTQQSVISRIEDADYDGHSLTTLNRIAAALKRKLRVEFYACRVDYDLLISESYAVSWQTHGEWHLDIPQSVKPASAT